MKLRIKYYHVPKAQAIAGFGYVIGKHLNNDGYGFRVWFKYRLFLISVRNDYI